MEHGLGTRSRSAVPRQTIVCGCFDVRVGDVRKLQGDGVTDADDIADQCGIGHACGACWQRLILVSDHPGGVAARLVSRRQVGERLFLCRFAPVGEQDFEPSFLPGQHIQVAVLVSGVWVSRPYTLVSSPEQPGYREIVIRHHEDGRVSGRLIGAGLPLAVRIGKPRGHAFEPLEPLRPTILLVAGVGLTTALAAGALSSMQGAKVKLVARSPAPGLLALLKRRLPASLTLLPVHDTARDGRLGRDELASMVAESPSAQWFLCGPPGFMRSSLRNLRSLGVRRDRIHEEFFARSSDLTEPAPARPRTAREQLVHTFGLFTIAAWLAQAAFMPGGVHPELLRSREVQQGSGVVLLLLLCWQFLLPVARRQRRFKLYVKRGYRHRLGGVLSILFFGLHAQSIGFGLTRVLGVVFLVTMALGLVDKTTISSPRLRATWMRCWLPAHILGAVLTAVLAAWHTYVMVTHSGFAP